MEGDARIQELLLENRSLRAKHTRMMQQLLYYHRQVTTLTWTDGDTRLFHQVFLRYQEAPPPLEAGNAALPPARLTQLLWRNNGRLWVVNQGLSRDLRLLETKFEELMTQRRCEAGTMTVKSQQEENLQVLEAHVDALKLEIRTLKDEKTKTEERERGLQGELQVLQTLMQGLQEEADQMDVQIAGLLETDVENLTFKQQKQALREQAVQLQSRKSQLEERLRRPEASTGASHCLGLMWRRFFTSR